MPTGKTDEAWLAQSDRARAALCALWTEFRAFWRRSCISKNMLNEDIQSDLHAFSADLSLEHLDSIKAEREEILSETANVAT